MYMYEIEASSVLFFFYFRHLSSAASRNIVRKIKEAPCLYPYPILCWLFCIQGRRYTRSAISAQETGVQLRVILCLLSRVNSGNKMTRFDFR